MGSNSSLLVTCSFTSVSHLHPVAPKLMPYFSFERESFPLGIRRVVRETRALLLQQSIGRYAKVAAEWRMRSRRE